MKEDKCVCFYCMYNSVSVHLHTSMHEHVV
jgi:hypothetical protein